MSIVSTIYYPDPRRSLARESARCRRSPLPRRSLPVDVVDDRDVAVDDEGPPPSNTAQVGRR